MFELRSGDLFCRHRWDELRELCCGELFQWRGYWLFGMRRRHVFFDVCGSELCQLCLGYVHIVCLVDLLLELWRGELFERGGGRVQCLSCWIVRLGCGCKQLHELCVRFIPGEHGISELRDMRFWYDIVRDRRKRVHELRVGYLPVKFGCIVMWYLRGGILFGASSECM